MRKLLTRYDLYQYDFFDVKNHYNNGGTLVYNKLEETLLKLCTDVPYEKLEYFQQLAKPSNITNPIEIFSSNIPEYLSAYSMHYFKNALTIKDFLQTKANLLTPSQKKRMIVELFQTLKTLHKYLVLGDIHLDNILIRNTAIICDWDSYRKLDEDSWIQSPYYINNDGMDQTPFTDTVKLTICCLSFYFNYNFETQLIQDKTKSFLSVFDAIEAKYPSLMPSFYLLSKEYFQNKEFSNLNAQQLVEQFPNHPSRKLTF